MKDLKLSITQFKILHTVSYLNSKKLYPLSEGVYKILCGTLDDETLSLKDCPTFGSLVSYSAKKISFVIMKLYRYDYLKKIFDRKSEKLYLLISEKGKTELDTFLKKHKEPYKKKDKKTTKTIIHIT